MFKRLILHAGHIEFLKAAKQLGDILVVGVHGDKDVEYYKRLPIVPYEQRLIMLQNISWIDQVIHAPLHETEDFYQEHSIDLQCQGNAMEGFYDVADQIGILRTIGRSSITDSSSIIQKIVDIYSQNS